MPTECAHVSCKNIFGKKKEVTFHRFPKNPKKRARWASLMKRGKDWSPQEYDRVCSCHFREEDFDRTGQTVRLRNGVEPCSDQVHLKKVCAARKKRKLPVSSSSSNDTSKDLQPPHQTTYIHRSTKLTDSIHNYAGKDGAYFKNKWLQAECRAEELEKKLQNSIRREKRFRSSLLNLQKELKHKSLLTKRLQQQLDGFEDLPIELLRTAESEYSEEQKKFALTLHLYGPKAYEFLRTKINLPSTRTLKRWQKMAPPLDSTCS